MDDTKIRVSASKHAAVSYERAGQMIEQHVSCSPNDKGELVPTLSDIDPVIRNTSRFICGVTRRSRLNGTWSRWPTISNGYFN